ncbi:MAG TPA: hypothetical protein VG102_00345 [Candidatus Paceibacterota bacterium]|nr:hypothetical protein [Candidatus Paceibacterota bacterium]
MPTAILFILALTAPTVYCGYAAATNDWFWPLTADQKARLAPVTHFFTVAEHAGWWALLLLNIPLGIAAALMWREWNAPLFAGVFIVMFIASLKMMEAWALADNAEDVTRKVLSAFSRDGLLTVPGVLLTLSMAFAYTIIAMYFLTPGPAANFKFSLFFALALSVYLPFGLLQPPHKVWGVPGKFWTGIHNAAIGQWLGGTALVWALFFLRALALAR